MDLKLIDFFPLSDLTKNRKNPENPDDLLGLGSPDAPGTSTKI